MNAIALLMLMLGILFLGQYQNALIKAKLENFENTVELIADAITLGAEEAPGVLSLQRAAEIVKTLASRDEHVIQVFNMQGQRILNSADLGVEEVSRHNEPRELASVRVLKTTAAFLIGLLPETRSLPLYPEPSQGVPDVGLALQGSNSLSAWQNKDDVIVLSAAAPLLHDGEKMGAVLVTREAKDIERDIAQLWIGILKIFFITFLITTAISIYLSGVIASPLRTLARAAEKIRTGRFQSSDIPDFSDRHDEIGELSVAFKTMTEALWERMDSIESFAADVSHELKNPLTSLRSAIETLGRVEKKEDQEKLMKIIQHDLARMDRLISDISNASRLDAELSRQAFSRVDVKDVLKTLIDFYQSPLARETQQKDEIITPENVKIVMQIDAYQDFYVMGIEERLAQVFRNLIDNALSFSKAGGSITVILRHEDARIVFSVEDEGPGIPSAQLEEIFERFYTERPQAEDYGQHSGLGLSICKQIIDAHDGKIFAKNIENKSGKVTGAHFSVILKTA